MPESATTIKPTTSVFLDLMAHLRGLLYACAAIVPCFMLPMANQIFEPPKWFMIKCFALPCMVMVLIQKRKERFPPFLYMAACLYAVSVLISTLLSPNFNTSFWGSSSRDAGFGSLMSLLFIFMATRTAITQERHRTRLFHALLLGSVTVCSVALWQRFGGEEMNWNPDLARRVIGTSGNPLYLASYLVLLIPLTIIRAFKTASERAPATLGYVAVAIIQLTTLWLTGARAAQAMLLIGLAIMLLYVLILFCQRKGVVIAMVALLAIIAAGFFFWPPISKQTDRLIRDGSLQTRMQFWRAAVDHPTPTPLIRQAVGWGPDTIASFSDQWAPPETGLFNPKNRTIDRSHNQQIDIYLNQGWLGVLAFNLLFVAAMIATLERTNLLRISAQKTAILTFVSIIFLATSITLSQLAGYFWGVTLTLAIIAGFVAHLFMLGWRTKSINFAPVTTLWPIGLLTGLIVHLLEVQMLFSTSSTALVSWLFFGLLALPEDRSQPKGMKPNKRPWITGILLVSTIVAIGQTMPSPLRANLMAGNAHRLQQDGLFSDAAEAFLAAAEIHSYPDYLKEAGLSLTQSAMRKRDRTEQIRQLGHAGAIHEQAMDIDPQHADHQVNWARVQVILSKLDRDTEHTETIALRARAAYQRAATLRPYEVHLYKEWTLAENQIAGNADAVTNWLKNPSKASPGIDDFWYDMMLANVYFLQATLTQNPSEKDQALRHAREWIDKAQESIPPERALLHAHRLLLDADIYHANGQLDLAIAQCQQASQQQVSRISSWQAFAKLAELYYLNDQVDQAKEAAEKALDKVAPSQKSALNERLRPVMGR